MCIYTLLSFFAGAHVNAKDGYQWSPLHFANAASANGNLGVTKLLLENGAFTFFSELYE